MIASRSQMSSVTGTIKRTVVTLSRRAEAPAVSRRSITKIRKGWPLAFFAAQMARYPNRPVCLSTPTITIIPKSKKITFQSMPNSSE